MDHGIGSALVRGGGREEAVEGMDEKHAAIPEEDDVIHRHERRRDDAGEPNTRKPELGPWNPLAEEPDGPQAVYLA